ncbi:zinc-binding alcohol dehydrogenase family protein [Rhodococcus sp. TAF43]|uniref:quinone oxidoreductase family protein n=1 Tax=unclassified Rhodococcus (in: high G+C Gram-positive bacteria) TaxID=192944 RepID=UPI001583EEDF|nr:zinc-binding dehydrogenase [Rhodococcus sp. W8901]QKT10412.1 zinc-binding dehydrogenase [Rhodococcus sp. W8901]
MRAAFHNEQGGTEVLRVGELPDPVPGPSDVLIRVRASALDRVDVYWREGSHGMRVTPPHVGGRDMAGTVVAMGEEARRLRPELSVGDDVVAMGRRGAHCELAVAPASWTFPMPAGCSYEQAAAIPTAGRSAYDALVGRAAIRPGEDVLVFAGGSGVGSFGIQIARAAGCRVFTTVGSPEKRKRAVELGADAVIDHHNDDIVARVCDLTAGQGVDVVLDHVGAPVFSAAIRSLRPFGRYVTTGVTAGHLAELHLGRVFERGLSVLGVGRPDEQQVRETLTALLRLVERGSVTPEVFAVLPLEEISAAHELMESSGFFGKIVLSVGK